MAALEVVVLGVGDTFSERHHSAALLLQCDGVSLAIDCPDTYRRVLRDAADRSGRALDLFDVDHVLVTHVHGDHMNGLEGAAFFKRFAQERRLHLIASPEVREVIWDQRLRAPMEQLWDGQQLRSLSFDDYFTWTPLRWTDETTIGPYTIRARRTRHHVPTSALLVEAGGRRFGYSADTAFDPDLVDFLSPADLIVHETNHGPAHTPIAALEALPAELRDKMRLIHYPDELDLAARRIEPAREGQILRP